MKDWKMRLSSCSVVASVFILFSQGREFNVVISMFMTWYVCSYIFSITPGNHNIETTKFIRATWVPLRLQGK